MEITFKMTEEMLQEAFQRAMENIEIQTLGLTLNACVEKQIAKKVEIKRKRPNGLYGKCPICDCSLVMMPYCPRCGQKLDWSDGNG